MPVPHPLLPQLARQDLVLRQAGDTWLVERADGRPICEPLATFPEARIVARTFGIDGRVWVHRAGDWTVLDRD